MIEAHEGPWFQTPCFSLGVFLMSLYRGLKGCSYGSRGVLCLSNCRLSHPQRQRPSWRSPNGDLRRPEPQSVHPVPSLACWSVYLVARAVGASSAALGVLVGAVLGGVRGLVGVVGDVVGGSVGAVGGGVGRSASAGWLVGSAAASTCPCSTLHPPTLPPGAPEAT